MLNVHEQKRRYHTWVTKVCWTICGASSRFPRKTGLLDALSSWEPLIWLNVVAGTPTTREPSMNNDDALLIWWDGKRRKHHTDEIYAARHLKRSLSIKQMVTDKGYLHHPWRQQHLDNGLGLTFIPARHATKSAEGGNEVLRLYHHDLPRRQASAFAAEGRNGCAVNVVSKVTRQSCSNLQRKNSWNFGRCSYNFVWNSSKACLKRIFTVHLYQHVK